LSEEEGGKKGGRVNFVAPAGVKEEKDDRIIGTLFSLRKRERKKGGEMGFSSNTFEAERERGGKKVPQSFAKNVKKNQKEVLISHCRTLAFPRERRLGAIAIHCSLRGKKETG